MTNKLIGMGRVANGRIMFATVDGNGFCAPVTKSVVKEVAIAPRRTPSRINIVFTFAQKNKGGN